jgi:hypothetical protein
VKAILTMKPSSSLIAQIVLLAACWLALLGEVQAQSLTFHRQRAVFKITAPAGQETILQVQTTTRVES